MSLLLILAKLWKYKLATLPVIALVIVGIVYVIAVKAPTYEANSSYILVSPPAPPTEAAIARNPSLGRINSDNPYLRFSDQSVIVQILSRRLASKDVRAALVRQGADPNYAAAPSVELGFSAPILQITGTGTSPAGALATAELVGRAMNKELDQMQAIRNVAKEYRIKTDVVVPAEDATLKASGKLRALVAVFALGTILLFMVVSVAEAVSALRSGWAGSGPDDEYVDLVGTVEPLTKHEPPPNHDADPARDAGHWLRAQRQ